jgi:undecaprenyl-diphosphatase
MEKLITLDTDITLYINNHYSEFLDPVMTFFSARTVWIPLYLLFIFGVYKATKKKEARFWLRLLITVTACSIAVGLADYISVHCFKNIFLRLRPCCEPALEELLRFHKGICTSHQYGFVSSHAANVFTLAAFLTPILKRYTMVKYGGVYLWAVIVGYSRIYLGAHYFGDVVCGALLGIIIGTAMFYTQRIAIQRLSRL